MLEKNLHCSHFLSRLQAFDVPTYDSHTNINGELGFLSFLIGKNIFIKSAQKYTWCIQGQKKEGYTKTNFLASLIYLFW